MILHSHIIGKGVPFVILHGFLGSGDNWKSLGNNFAENGYQVHLVDQRNHGRSFHSEEFSYELLVEDLKVYCEHYRLENFILLGHSMGGKTAMLFAVTYPNKVEKLIVADIGPKAYPEHHQALLEALYLLDFSKLKTRIQVDEFLSAYIKDIGIRQFLLKNLYWKNKDELGWRFNLDVLIHKIEEVGKALPVGSYFGKDTLFLRGDKSEYILKTDEILIKIHFPKAKVYDIANAGHWLHSENPVEFAHFVVNFL